jgi:hypothetical protein
MAAFRVKMLGSALLGLLVAVTAIVLLSARRETPPPVLESRPVETPPAAAPVTPEPPRAAADSRSRGQSDWAFFFRPGDTLSRMADGSALGVVLRLERQHRFADGSTGPAYVVRLEDKEEAVFDADELERRARIEAIQDPRVPPTRRPDGAARR